ncbi:MAG: hypothetical protein ACXWC4_16415 [Telluria sp.]
MPAEPFFRYRGLVVAPGFAMPPGCRGMPPDGLEPEVSGRLRARGLLAADPHRTCEAEAP